MENENKELNTIEAESQDSAQPVVDGKKVLLRLRDVKQYFPVKKTKLREKQPAAASPRWAAPFCSCTPRATATSSTIKMARPSI